MHDDINKLEDINDKKDQIRTRYKGLNSEELELIPAIAQENFFDDTREKRVAVYVRVSTDDPRQTSSYELQKNHYTDLVNQHPNWKLVKIYADEGISGTSLQHRKAFISMINDCHEGKIDFIVTKSVSRFARNVLDCIGHVRELAALQPPIGILFETENIYTLNRNSEMSLSIISTLAQEESHNKSEIMNASIEMRFKRGIFLTPPLLGYDQDEDGNLVINNEEAKTVRLVFFMYLYGYSSLGIADTLTKLGRLTKKNNVSWSSNSVIQILQNERHCGDVLARKTWTPNYLDHKSRKNKQDRNQYRKRDNHEAIVSRDDFIAVQHLINNAKYGHKGILPKLQVIPDGALRGFVSVNPRWSAFSAENYQAASDSAYKEIYEVPDTLEVEAKKGDFDLRGFEIARSQFFNTARKIFFTLSPNYFSFNIECIRKFEKTVYIELLVHPRKQLLIIRPCTKRNKNAIRWANVGDDQYYPRNISCGAYIETLYNIFNWEKKCKHSVRGLYKTIDLEKLIVFDINETEVLIPQTVMQSEQDIDTKANVPEDFNLFTVGSKKHVKAFPTAWADSFGSDFYRHNQFQELLPNNAEGDWQINDERKPYNEPHDIRVTDAEVVSNQINSIMLDMNKENQSNGE